MLVSFFFFFGGGELSFWSIILIGTEGDVDDKFKETFRDAYLSRNATIWMQHLAVSAFSEKITFSRNKSWHVHALKDPFRYKLFFSVNLHRRTSISALQESKWKYVGKLWSSQLWTQFTQLHIEASITAHNILPTKKKHWLPSFHQLGVN